MLHLPLERADAQALRCSEDIERPVLSGNSACFCPRAVRPAGDRSDAHVTAVRFWSLGGCYPHRQWNPTAIFSIRSDRLENPDRLFFDLVGTKPDLGAKGITVIPVSDKLVRQIRVAETQHGVTRVVLDLAAAG